MKGMISETYLSYIGAPGYENVEPIRAPVKISKTIQYLQDFFNHDDVETTLRYIGAYEVEQHKKEDGCMKKITGYLIDVQNGTAGPVTIDKSLESYYKVLNCEFIDIVSRAIGSEKRVFDIICDDEALMNDDARLSAVDTYGNMMLFGNLLIVKFDGVDDEMSLTEDGIRYVRQYVKTLGTYRHPEPYPILTWVEYE